MLRNKYIEMHGQQNIKICNSMSFKHLDVIQLSRCAVRATNSVVFEKL